MKVLEVNSVSYGSTGRIMCGIARSNKNIDFYVAYGRGNKPHGIKSIKIGNKLLVLIYVLLNRLFDLNGTGSIIATKKFIKKIEFIKPDVIHLHNLHGYYLNYKVFFKFLKEYNAPVIWTFHDCWTVTGHCGNFDGVKCDNWKNECQKCRHKNLYPKSLLFNNSKKNYLLKKIMIASIKNLTIVTPSNWLKNIVENSFLKTRKIIIINNGIDTNVFKIKETNIRKKYNLENKRIVLGVASTWTDKKGFDDFIELSKKITEDYKIVMIGLNKKQLRILPSNILGIERTESIEELSQWYNTADAFYNPTKEDNYPTVLLEAIACGLNILTAKVGGCPEIVEMSTNYDYCNDDKLVNQIKDLSDKDKNIIINNRDISIECSNKKYIDLYNKLTK